MSDVQDAGYWQGRTAGRVSRRGVLRTGVTSLAGGAALGLFGCSGSKAPPAINAPIRRPLRPHLQVRPPRPHHARHSRQAISKPAV